jgi:hypothetical protein
VVDLIYGRGITDIIREIPLYFGIFEKIVGIKLFNRKLAMYGSVDVVNVRNLHCTHCYWWLNRKEEGQELSADNGENNRKDYQKTENICCYFSWWRANIKTRSNSLNHNSIDDLLQEWKGVVNKIGFQFHTPFVKGDPLWFPFGQERNKVVDKLIALREKYPDFVINSKKQLTLMKGNWGGIGTTPVQCPSWAILSLDHMGREKKPCCIGSADSKSLKPICEDCGLGCYSVLVANGITG